MFFSLSMESFFISVMTHTLSPLDSLSLSCITSSPDFDDFFPLLTTSPARSEELERKRRIEGEREREDGNRKKVHPDRRQKSASEVDEEDTRKNRVTVRVTREETPALGVLAVPPVTPCVLKCDHFSLALRSTPC